MVGWKRKCGGCANNNMENGYAYVVCLGDGLQIIDIDPPGSASIVKAVDTSGEASNITLDGGYAYIADGISDLRVIDVDTPVFSCPRHNRGYFSCLSKTKPM